MKIAIKSQGAAAPFVTQDYNLEAIADRLKAGVVFSPPEMPEHLAEFIVVTVPVQGNEADYLNHPFTQTHASLVACSDRWLILMFVLKTPVEKKGLYRLLQRGLSAKYQGSLSIRTADQAFGGIPGMEVRLTGQILSAEAFEHVIMAGKEQLAIAGNRDHYLSAVTVEGSDVFDSEYQHELPLARVPDGELLRCPFHVGGAPSAEAVTLQDGGRGLVCHTCKRSFGPSARPPRYDFSRFDQMVDELNRGPAANHIKLMSSKYLPKGLVNADGIWLVKSPKGSGKTELLQEVIAQARAVDDGQAIASKLLVEEPCESPRGKTQAERVLLLGHRRTLLRSMTKRLGIDCYFTLDNELAANAEMPEPDTSSLLWDEAQTGDAPAPNGPEMVRVDPTGYYGVCLDSMSLLSPATDRYDVVLIDECEQVFSHLVGATLKEKRKTVFKLIEHYIRVAKRVILLDADLSMVTMQALFSMGIKPDTKIHVVVNKPFGLTTAVTLYEDNGHLVETLKRTVAKGKKTFVAVNAKKKAIELAQMLTKLNPDRRIEVVHADNANSAEIQRLLKNLTLEFEGSLDVLIASPALATGVDISFYDAAGSPRAVVEQVFGLFRNNITTHFEIDQHLFRVRHPKEVHVWVDSAEMNYDPDPAVIRAELLKTVARDMVLLGFDDAGHPQMSDDALVDIWTEVKAAQRGSKNILKQSFLALRRANRSEILRVELDEPSNRAGKESLREARDLRMKAEAASIVSAEDLDEETFKFLNRRIDEGLPVRPEQQWAVMKSWLARFYKDPAVDVELVAFDEDGRTRHAIRNLEVMLAETTMKAATQGRKESGGGRFDAKAASDLKNAAIFDLPMQASKREVLRTLLGAAGLFNHAANQFNVNRSVRHAGLRDFAMAIDRERHRLTTLFDIPVRADYKSKPVQQLGQILRLVGLGLKQAVTKDEGGSKVREYQLDAERLATLLDVVERRRLEDQDEQEQRRPVVGKPGASKGLVEQVKKWRGQS